MLVICIVCVVFLLILCCVLGYKLYEYSLIILDIESAIEESLDVLNDNYNEIGKILQKEIFFDSIEVRQTIASIKASHDSLLEVANKLTNQSGIKSGEIEKENQSNKE